MTLQKLTKGQLLIAEPTILSDASFNRSVILLADHSTEGSVGFILNKPLPYTLDELVSGVDCQFTIYNGGPVEQDNLYFIHNVPELLPNSIEIDQGIYWGGDFDLLIELLNQQKISRENIRFFLGYTGWGAKQLEDEMLAHAWIGKENSYAQHIIGKSSTNFWKEELDVLGGEYQLWSNAPENPVLN